MNGLLYLAIPFFIFTSSEASSSEEIPKKVSNAVQKQLLPATVQFTEASTTSFTAWVTYPLNSHISIVKVKKDTIVVAREILKLLATSGRHPGPDDIVFIHVHAVQQAKGETREGLRELGNATYDFNRDRIDFSF